MSIAQKTEMYMIVLNEPEFIDYDRLLNRTEKYTVLGTNTFEYWESIRSFIRNNDYVSEVSVFNLPTRFDSLSIKCSERLADKLIDLDCIQELRKT